MRISQLTSLYISMLMMIANTTLAWNATGHQIVAEIAWQHLTPHARALVDAQLKKMPDHQDRLSAAIWPDDLKSKDVKLFNRWHFIDIPYYASGKKKKSAESFFKHNKENNIVWAINQMTDILQNPKAQDWQPQSLCFLIHFVGDLHQPLHAISLFNTDFPHGDHGGTFYEVSLQGETTNLHKLWDSGFGLLNLSKQNPAAFQQLVQSIQKKYPMDHFAAQLKEDNPYQWAMESHVLAKHNAYRVLPHQVIADRDVKNAQAVVESQLALAGYRLAQRLNTLF